jgi:hypothetical protein
MESGGDSERTVVEFRGAMSRVGKNGAVVRAKDGLKNTRNDDAVWKAKQKGEIEIEIESWKGNLRSLN